MDHIRIIKRAFSITASYRALWVFGIVLALTMGGRSGGSFNGGAPGGPGPGNFPRPVLTPELINALIIAGIVIVSVAVLLGLLAVIARYVSETALVRMVDQYEATGEKLSVRQGFRLGWSRLAWRLFLVDLVVGLTVFVIFVLAAGVAALPLLVWLTQSDVLRVLGSVVAGLLGMLVIFAAIVAAIALSLLGQLWHRAVVLEGLGLREALRRGWALLRRHLGDVLIMGLILFGLGLAWAFVVIPIVLILLVVAFVAAAVPALLAYAITGLLTQGAAPWIVAAVVGAPIFIVILAAPLAVLGGLVETFRSTTWTLTYRELLALEAARPAPATGDL